MKNRELMQGVWYVLTRDKIAFLVDNRFETSLKGEGVMSGYEKRLAIFEDHALMRDGITTWFATNSDWRVMFSAGTVEEAQELIATLEHEATQEKPVIALVDISFKQEMSATLPNGSEGHAGFDIVRELSARSPHTKCIMYSSYSSGSFVECALSKNIGAMGYVSKSSDESELLHAVETVATGEVYVESHLISKMLETQRIMSVFTKKERKIVEGIVLGDSTAEIAEKLGVSRSTIENHLSHIYDKIGIKSKEALIACLGQ